MQLTTANKINRRKLNNGKPMRRVTLAQLRVAEKRLAARLRAME